MKEYKRRSLEELNIIDNFLFNEMLDMGEDSKWFCKTLIERITGKKFESVELISKKTIQGIDTDMHGIEMDVYVRSIEEEFEDDKVYDVEPNVYWNSSKSRNRRARYYHGLMDARVLKSGNNYDDLPDMIVVFIFPYDPFGKGDIQYTIKNQCVEYPEMDYDDGAKTLFLYTKGDYSKLQYGKELSDMLLFLENSSVENAGVDSDLRRMKNMADRIKSSPEKGAKHMRLEDEMYYRSQEAGREIAKELAPEMAKDMAQEMAQDMAQEMAQEMAQDMVIKFLVSIYDKTESEAKELVEKYWEKNS